MNYTDTQLKKALAKMLPDTVELCKYTETLSWGLLDNGDDDYVKNTELLHLCWMVEETITNPDTCVEYFDNLIKAIRNTNTNLSTSINAWSIHATWQQRIIALAKVKGVEIV